MSEHAPHHEKSHSPEATSEHIEHVAHKPEQHAETATEAERPINEIRHDVAEQAHSKDEMVSDKNEKDDTAEPAFVTRSVKLQARTRLLKRIRGQLPAQQRALSRVIHQPVVDSLSELGGKTIARPSGLLSGGICAFLGSSLFLYIDKHYGYHYNFLLWAMFFVGGFVLGLVLEIVISLVVRLRS